MARATQNLCQPFRIVKHFCLKAAREQSSHINGISQDVFVMICIEGSEKKLTQQQWVICITCAYRRAGGRSELLDTLCLGSLVFLMAWMSKKKKSLIKPFIWNSHTFYQMFLLFLCQGALINSHHSVSQLQILVHCHSCKILCKLTTPKFIALMLQSQQTSPIKYYHVNIIDINFK